MAQGAGIEGQQIGREQRQRLARFDPGQFAAVQEGDQLVGIRRCVGGRRRWHHCGGQLRGQPPQQFVAIQLRRVEGAQVDFHAVEADQFAGAVDAVEGGLQRRQDQRVEAVAQHVAEAAEGSLVRRSEVEHQPADAMLRACHSTIPRSAAG
ncbi:hypothetical protein D9M71_263240 [compost metagenome]